MITINNFTMNIYRLWIGVLTMVVSVQDASGALQAPNTASIVFLFGTLIVALSFKD